MMDVKQEPVDIHEDEPDLVNIDEIKQEIIGYGVPKIEQCSNYFLPKIVHDSAFENAQVDPTIVKKELENISDIKPTYICNIKQEVPYKIESVHLTTHCDLPTLKNESTEFPDFFGEPCGRKQGDRISKSFKSTSIASKTKRRFPCPVCQKYLISSKSRSKHIDGHFRKRFVVCGFCGKCMKKNEFLRHYCIIYLVKNRTRKVSRTVVVEEPRLIVKTRKKLHKCDICSKKFNKKSNLQRHLIIHTDDKPFKCNICSKEFKFKSILQEHLLIHTNVETFSCEICSKEFKQKSYLRKHLKTHAKEKPFKCVICFKGFDNKINLQQHLIIHFNKKPFKCDVCSKEFPQKNNLQKHLITHTDDTPFKCDVCSKGFKRKSILQRHVLIHSNKKPVQ